MTTTIMDETIAVGARVRIEGGEIEIAGSGNRMVIGEEARIVGRDPSCHLVLDDRRVSAAHLELVATDRGVRLRDLGSRNGTFVAGMRVVDVCLTQPVDVLVGSTTLKFLPTGAKEIAALNVERFGELVGSTPGMQKIFALLARIAPRAISVLITGETGTGKELVARAIHDKSPRRDRPFLAINCSGMPDSLLEGELFGHERGAFTGADKARAGLFADADGGTLFLDELGEMSPAMQAKLLRVLEDGEVRPLGSSRTRKVDVRVVAATRAALVRDVNEGRFRSDLFFRLAKVHVELPPLRERTEDIPAIVARLMERCGWQDGFARISAESWERLTRYDWPGNVRELNNIVERAFALDDGGPVHLAAHVGILSEARMEPEQVRPYDAEIEDFDRVYWSRLYAACKGNKSEMARRSGEDPKTVRGRLRDLGIGRTKPDEE